MASGELLQEVYRWGVSCLSLSPVPESLYRPQFPLVVALTSSVLSEMEALYGLLEVLHST